MEPTTKLPGIQPRFLVHLSCHHLLNHRSNHSIKAIGLGAPFRYLHPSPGDIPNSAPKHNLYLDLLSRYSHVVLEIKFDTNNICESRDLICKYRQFFLSNHRQSGATLSGRY
jgi:hypothetical protein